MTLIFTITYGLRAVYAGFDGHYFEIWTWYARRWIDDILYMFWDLPSIMSFLLVNYSLVKQVRESSRRTEIMEDLDDSQISCENSILSVLSHNDRDETDNRDSSESKINRSEKIENDDICGSPRF